MRSSHDAVRCGCADTCTGLAIGNLDEVIAFTKENSF